MDAEFTLAKRQYIHQTGRVRGAVDVIAYHFRQAFKPGEVTPEEANQIGQELAMRLTKGNNAFIVCTHIDKHHVHNHIIVSAVNLECTKKFRNFWGSSWALRRISDKLCLEHGLSIVEDPKPSHSHYGKWLGDGNKPLSFQNQIRQAIDAAMRSGKGAGYERWAKVFNVKQLAKAVAYLKEHGDMSYEDLQAKAQATTSRFNELSTQIKDMESCLSQNGKLQKQIVNYSKTRAVYIEYRKAGYSKKFRAGHEADILIHQAAKKYFDSLGVEKLPTIKALREEYAEVLEAKRKAYAEYKQLR